MSGVFVGSVQALAVRAEPSYERSLRAETGDAEMRVP
jgi:hypothetical protein